MGLFRNLLRVSASGSSKAAEKIRLAEAGDVAAQYSIGCYYERIQIPTDFQEAEKWYRKAALQGHAGAQLYLGILLAQGKGVEQDIVEGYMWIELAKGGNVLDRSAAKETCQRLSAYMTSEQISEAERRASEFVPKK